MALLQIIISAVIFATALIASGHAVIYKREPRAAALWLLVIWLIPAAGSILYLLLGVNRVRRQAVAMRSEMVHHRTTTTRPRRKLVDRKSCLVQRTNHSTCSPGSSSE